MKARKSFFIVLVIGLLLTSCVVKSLHPFYTRDILYFEPQFVGQWMDTDSVHWNIQPFKEVFLKENHHENPSELDEDELKTYNNYKEGYVVYYEKDSTKTTFLAMPFKINNQLFLDFTPIEDRESQQTQNDLYQMHLINTHSLAKLDIVSNNSASIKWLDQDKLEALLKADKIKIKYEKVGFDETILLTASSDELVKFIEKYMNSEDAEKWKTDIEFNLKRTGEQ
ncbi:MAG TPA: hypothetical protein VJ945_08275 [Flavobacteriaceae bacterium]|nr:hypothetical protein [Flavobacteriaceae bacterium]